MGTKLTPEGVTDILFTVTPAFAVPLLPAASTAVKVTEVRPTGKTDGASLLTVPTTPTLSVAVAAARNATIS